VDAPTSIIKLGINPTSSYDTPIGIYSYPIKAYWRNIESGSLPFASDRPILWVYKAKRPNRVAYSSSYSEEDLEKDLEILEEMFPKHNIRNIIGDLPHSYTKFPLQIFWSVTRQLALTFNPVQLHISDKGDAKENYTRASVMWTKILQKFYDGIVDDAGTGTIHGNEPYQAVFWTTNEIHVVDKIDRRNPTHDPHGEKSLWKSEDFKSNYNNVSIIPYLIKMFNANKEDEVNSNIQKTQLYNILFELYQGSYEVLYQMIYLSIPNEKNTKYVISNIF